METCEDIYRAHHARRVALKVEKRGNVIGPAALLDLLPKAAFKIRDWRDGTAPKTKEAAFRAIVAANAYAEVQFDAAHGRRYYVCVFAKDDRAAVVTFGTWPSDE